MKKIILAAAVLAPLAAAPAFAQVEATERNTVTQYQTQSQAPREFTARRAYQAPASQAQQAPNNQLQGGNF
jgi:opacity protein-like surface antigen